MSEEDFREGLPTKEQIEAHYEPGKPYGYWRRKGDPRAFRLGWHNDEVVYDCTPWLLCDRLMSAPTHFGDSAWQPMDSSNNLLPWSVVEVSEYRTPTDDPASPILPTPPTPPTRFSLLELDDDIVTAKPTLLHTDGKAPTAVQVRRYRDAMESRIGVDLAKAAKDAQLDEVAVYMLHRWLRGLDDDVAALAVAAETYKRKSPVNQDNIDRACESYWRQRYGLDTREPVDTATQRRRQDVEEQRRRLADLAAKLAQERAADTTAPTEVTRWSLLELDGAAPVIEPTPTPAPQPAPDPLTVWWSRRAAQLAKRPAPSRFRIYPPPVPKRIDDWTTLPTELRDAALSYYVVTKGLEGLLN